MAIEDKYKDCPGHPRCCWDVDNTSKSEVAALMQQISAEYSAAHAALHGPACVASHQAITARMERVATYCTTLQNIVGEEQGTVLTMQAMEAAPDPQL